MCATFAEKWHGLHRTQSLSSFVRPKIVPLKIQPPNPYSLIPAPAFLFPDPYSLFPNPCSLIPIPYSLFPTPYSLIPIPQALFTNPYYLIPNSYFLIPIP